MPTRSASISNSSGNAPRIASRCGPMRGLTDDGEIDVGHLAAPGARAVPPRSRTGGRTPPASAGSAVGKSWPISPRPPRRAAHRSGHAGGHIGVRVALQAGAVWDANATQPDVIARHRAMHIKAGPGAHVGQGVGGLAIARSSAVVSLRLARFPAPAPPASPAHSATAASSLEVVASRVVAARWAARMGEQANPCGVCARHRRSRSIIGRCGPRRRRV